MSKRENTFIFMLFLLILGQTLVSCKDDEDGIDETLPRVIENLPNAENVKSTTAFIPFDEKRTVGVVYGFDENIIHPTDHMVYVVYCNYLDGEDGVHLKGLEPSRTYYYTTVYYNGKEEIYSKQIKTFTTQGVKIEFIGQGESNKLRFKTYAAEEWDEVLDLSVALHGVNEQGVVGGLFTIGTNYIGDGVWELDFFIRPVEGDRWKAVIKCYNGREVAETPVYTFVNGEWKV